MSVAMTNLRADQEASFWQSANGKKVVMAITGVLMFLFVIGHLLGNLLIFAGWKAFNDYARLLHFDETLLWIVRTLLIIAIVLHIIATVQLAMRNKKARTIGYSRWQPSTPPTLRVRCIGAVPSFWRSSSSICCSSPPATIHPMRNSSQATFITMW